MATLRPIHIYAALLLIVLLQTTSATSQASSSDRVVTLGSTESNAKGRTAVESLMKALGGAAQVNSVRTLRQDISMVQQGQEIKIDQSIAYPDKQAQLMTLAGGQRVRFVVTPTLAFTVVGTETHDLPLGQRAASDAALKHDFLNVLQHANNPKYKFVSAGKQKVGNIDATVVDVDADGTHTRWWIGPYGTLLQEEASDTGQPLLMKYSTWKDFGGLRYPTKYEVFDAAGPRFSMTLVTMRVNAAIDPRVFEKPDQ